MGLLTNPNAEDSNKLLQLLKTRNGEIGILSYVISLVWIVFLANSSYNLKTYFSENALLPGLVVEHFDGATRINSYITELTEMEEKNNGVLAVSDVVSLFHKMGLMETELQNFTVVHPVMRHGQDEGSVINGVNAFAVLRAKRAAGTESLILNTPYFSRNASGRRNIVGIATMLAIAEYFQEQVYWAKDIVFIVSEGHTGTLAWVKGHQEIRDYSGNLFVEHVRTKVGSIQAAINFVLEGRKVCSMETKFHGVNGQLPNLDLVNLLNKFVFNLRDYDRSSNWEVDFWRLCAYMQTQATGSPTGSHGFFLKYGTESVTLFGKSGNCKRPAHYGDVGRVLEATYRSLNNLLERFHQSFFFYLKTSPHRFVSIGLYFPPLALVLLSIPLKAAAIWLTETNLETTLGLFYLGIVHFVSIGFRWILSHLEIILPSGFEMNPLIFAQLVVGMGLLQFMLIQILLRIQSRDVLNAVYCFVLLESGVSLYTLGLFNPSLVFILGIASVPFITLFFVFRPSRRSFIYLGVCAILAVALSYALAEYTESFIVPVVNKYFYESEIYGNFIFDFFFVLLVPLLSSVVASI